VSPRSKARLAGAFYLLVFVTGALAAPSGRLIVAGDTEATAVSITSHEALYLSGATGYILNVACYIVVTALFYQLFKPAGRTLSLTAAFFSLVGCATQAVTCVFYIAPVIFLSGDKYLSVFDPAQLHAFALSSLKLFSTGYDVGLAFFGFYCLLIGWLILRSTFMPKAIGVLMVIAGLGWLTFNAPVAASHLQPYIVLPGFVGELSLTLWLLVKGIDEQRWLAQAATKK